MLQNSGHKQTESIMSRFAAYRIPGSHHIAYTSQAEEIRFEKKADRSVRVCVIIPVYNEADTLPLVLSEVNLLPYQLEVICILNGCQDKSGEIACKYGARILQFPDAFGHDLGRSVGAAAASEADIYLFTDADFAVKSEDLAIFVQAVYNGVDVALNDFSGLLGTDALYHPVNICKYFLNIALRLGRLGPSSLTTVPHGLSRRAIQTAGFDALSCPPLAFTKMVLEGLNIHAVHYVDVVTVNKRVPDPLKNELLTDLIIGDHLEALSYLESKLGKRGWFPDNVRQRELLKKAEVISYVNSE